MTDRELVEWIRAKLEACVGPDRTDPTKRVLKGNPHLTAQEIDRVLQALPQYNWMRGFTPKSTVLGAPRNADADVRLRDTLAEIDAATVRYKGDENRQRAEAYARAAAERGYRVSKCRCAQFHLGWTHAIVLTDGEYHSTAECTPGATT